MSTGIIHLPFFPLNIFLLPGEQLPLHVFEPRYRQLFKEAEEDGIKFGLPFEDKEHQRGFVSICRLVKVVKRYETGESDVIIEAIDVAELKDYEPVYLTKLYPGGFATPWSSNHLRSQPAPDLVEAFRQYIWLKFGTKPQAEHIANYRLLDVAASIVMSNEDKVKFLLTTEEDQLHAFLVQTVRYLNLLLTQEGSTENGIILN